MYVDLIALRDGSMSTSSSVQRASVGFWLPAPKTETTLNGHSSTSAQGRRLLAPLLQRNIHISLPVILRCLGINAQVMEEQRLVTKFLSTGRKPIAVNRIDRF